MLNIVHCYCSNIHVLARCRNNGIVQHRPEALELGGHLPGFMMESHYAAYAM